MREPKLLDTSGNKHQATVISYTLQLTPMLLDQTPPGIKAYILYLSSTYYFSRTSQTYLIWSSKWEFRLCKADIIYFTFKLRQEMFTFYYYSLEPCSTLTQGLNLSATFHSWLKWSDSQGHLVSLRTRDLRAELKLYLSPYSSPRIQESPRGGYHSALLWILLPWKWVMKGSNGTHGSTCCKLPPGPGGQEVKVPHIF